MPRCCYQLRRSGVVLLALVLSLSGWCLSPRLETAESEQEGSTESMHIEFKTEGGPAYFPGLARPTVIELSDAESQEFEKLVEAAGFFERPAQPPPPPKGAADYRIYTITVQQGERRHTIRVTPELNPDPNLDKVIGFLKKKEQGLRATKRQEGLP